MFYHVTEMWDCARKDWSQNMIFNTKINAIVGNQMCVVRSLLVNTNVWQRARYVGNYIVYII